jgi:hypothetical protein
MLIYEVGYVILPLPRNVVKSVFRPLAGANEESGGLDSPYDIFEWKSVSGQVRRP